MYGDLQISIMIRQAEREYLAHQDMYLRRAGWYAARTQLGGQPPWRRSTGVDTLGRLGLALMSRTPLPSGSIIAVWRRQAGDGREHDRPPARACLPM